MTCGPLLLLFSAASSSGFKKTAIGYAIFSSSRVFVYIFLGLCIFSVGRATTEHLLARFAGYLFIAGGIFLLLVAASIIFGSKTDLWLCSALHSKLIGRAKKSYLILGLLAGVAPCAPLLAVLSYAALISKSYRDVAGYMLAFGLGTAASPLFLLTSFLGGAGALIKNKYERFYALVNILCAGLIVLMAIQLIFRGVRLNA